MRPPEKLTIDTPEQIALEFPLAGAGSRFLALAIDTFVQIAILLVLALVGLIALWFRSLGFPIARDVGRRGARPARLSPLLRILCRVRGALGRADARQTRRRPARDFGHRAAHHAHSTRCCATSSASSTRCPASMRWVCCRSSSRRATSGWAISSRGTVVVQEQGLAQAELSSTPVLATTRLGAARLSIEEVEVIQTFLARRADLPEYLRMHTAGQLAHRIRQRLELAPGASETTRR